MKRKYSVHDILEVAKALRVAVELDDSGVEEVEADDIWGAIEKVLELHPNQNVINWAKKCLHDLKGEQ